MFFLFFLQKVGTYSLQVTIFSAKKYRRKELIVIKPAPLPCALNRGGSAANKTAETIMLITTTTPIPIIFFIKPPSPNNLLSVLSLKQLYHRTSYIIRTRRSFLFRKIYFSYQKITFPIPTRQHFF